MKKVSWKNYKNIYTPKTYYTSVGSFKDYNFLQVKVSEANIGVSQDNTHHSKKVYHISLTDGYKDIRVKFYVQGLTNSKKVALEMLETFKNKAA